MADFAPLESPKFISRKIWVLAKKILKVENTVRTSDKEVWDSDLRRQKVGRWGDWKWIYVKIKNESAKFVLMLFERYPTQIAEYFQHCKQTAVLILI